MDDDHYEKLAAQFLCMLAKRDMRAWKRHFFFDNTNSGPEKLTPEQRRLRRVVHAKRDTLMD
jgi:hypothetical protein